MTNCLYWSLDSFAPFCNSGGVLIIITTGCALSTYAGFPCGSYSPSTRIAEITVGLRRKTVPSSNVTSVHLSVDSATPTSVPSFGGLVGVGYGIMRFFPGTNTSLRHHAVSDPGRPWVYLSAGCSFALTLAHLVKTAFLALSLRSSTVMLAARAGPPFLPPFLPRATAYGFFRFFAIYIIVRERSGTSRKIFQPNPHYLQARSMFRNVGLLVCQGKERPPRNEGQAWIRGRLDLDSTRPC